MSNKIKETAKLLMRILGFLMLCIAVTYAGGGSENAPFMIIIIGLVGLFLLYKSEW